MRIRRLVTAGFATVLVAAGVLAPPRVSLADESRGECFVLRAGVEVEQWDGPTLADLGQCAALAAEQAESGAVSVGKSRWLDVEIQANQDGSFEAFRAGELAWRGFWDVDKLVAATVDDIDAFWRREFEARGWTYESPARVQGYVRRIRTACGRSVPNNAFYCQVSHSIYYDTNLLRDHFAEVGDFAPAVVVAHEWGHAVQFLRGAGESRQRQSLMRLEQQADCFAGAYVRDAAARTVLREGDVEEARELFRSLPSRRSTHGTPRQRLAAFERGFEGGPDACLN